MKGKFITFEGSEGSGKSTQIELINKYLIKKDVPLLFVREPGGVQISEKIRKILLDVKNIDMCMEAEMLLYMASRAQLVNEVVIPALKDGKVVLCDRFLDSTIAYQGYGSGIDIEFIKKVGRYATQNVQPNLTLVFDIDAKVGLERINRAKDRIENRAIAYHNRVRSGYLDLARKDPQRIKTIEVNKSKEEIHEIVKSHINTLLKIKD